MRSILTILAATVGISQACAAPATDPSTGPWWKAPEVSFILQPEDGDADRADGFLAPILHLKRLADGRTYSVDADSRHVLRGDTRELPRCSVEGRVGPTAPGGLSGSLKGFGRIALRDVADGIAEIEFEKPGDCFRSGRYLGTWTAPH